MQLHQWLRTAVLLSVASCASVFAQNESMANTTFAPVAGTAPKGDGLPILASHVAPAFTDSAVIVAVASACLSGLVSPHAYAASQGPRTAALVRLAKCANHVDTPISATAYPVTVPLGSGPFRYHVGAMLLNPALIILIVGLHAGTSIVANTDRKPLAEAIAAGRFPSASIPVFTWLLQDTVTSSFTVALHGIGDQYASSDDVFWRAIASLVLAAGFVGVVSTSWLLNFRVRVSWVRLQAGSQSNGDGGVGAALAEFVAGRGDWVDQSVAHGVGRDVGRFGSLFRAYKGNVFKLVGPFELCVSYLLDWLSHLLTQSRRRTPNVARWRPCQHSLCFARSR
jgi:hypothetical protein